MGAKQEPVILVAGGVNLDTVYRVRELPRPGETVSAGAVLQSFGGKGLNQALAVRRAGGAASLVGAVGVDPAGSDLRAFLAAQGIGTSYLATIPEARTGRAVIAIDKHAENTIIVDAGANALCDAGIVGRLNVPDLEAVVANGEVPGELARRLFEHARRCGATTIWNPSPPPADIDPILRLTDILVVNRTEARALTGSTAAPERLIRLLAAAGPSEIVLTLGGKGSLLRCGGRTTPIPAHEVQAVDPTAAGDTFLGYYAVCRCRKRTPVASAIFATHAAALCVQVIGASASIPHLLAVAAVAAGPPGSRS